MQGSVQQHHANICDDRPDPVLPTVTRFGPIGIDPQFLHDVCPVIFNRTNRSACLEGDFFVGFAACDVDKLSVKDMSIKLQEISLDSDTDITLFEFIY